MIGIVNKTHPLYLLIEVTALSIVTFAACFFLSMRKSITQTSTPITSVDNFSNAWVFSLPSGLYNAFSVKQTAQVTYSSTKDLDTWPFTVDVDSYFGTESNNDRYVKLNTEPRVTETYQEHVFFEQDFQSKIDPIFSDVFVARNPLVSNMGVLFEYCVPIDPSLIISIASLCLIIFIPKNYYINVLIVLFFLAFSPFTKSYSALLYSIFTSYIIFITYRQTQKHSISPSKLTDLFIPCGIALAVLNVICSFFQFGFQHTFKLSESPFTILVGMCIVQVVGLVAFSQGNIPIILSFCGCFLVYIPYVLQIFLAVYLPPIQAVSIANTAAQTLGFLSLIPIIISESLLERDDVVSEDVMGVIARENTSSSSGDISIRS